MVGLVLAEARKDGRVGGVSVAHGGRERELLSAAEALCVCGVVECRSDHVLVFILVVGRRESADSVSVAEMVELGREKCRMQCRVRLFDQNCREDVGRKFDGKDGEVGGG